MLYTVVIAAVLAVIALILIIYTVVALIVTWKNLWCIALIRDIFFVLSMLLAAFAFILGVVELWDKREIHGTHELAVVGGAFGSFFLGQLFQLKVEIKSIAEQCLAIIATFFASCSCVAAAVGYEHLKAFPYAGRIANFLVTLSAIPTVAVAIGALVIRGTTTRKSSLLGKIGASTKEESLVAFDKAVTLLNFSLLELTACTEDDTVAADANAIRVAIDRFRSKIEADQKESLQQNVSTNQNADGGEANASGSAQSLSQTTRTNDPKAVVMQDCTGMTVGSGPSDLKLPVVRKNSERKRQFQTSYSKKTDSVVIRSMDPTLVVVPSTATFGVASKHKFINKTDKRLAFKVRSSNNSNYTVSLSSGLIDPGQSLDFVIKSRKGKANDEQLIVFQFVDVAADAVDASAAFVNGPPTGAVIGETTVKISADE